MGLSILHPRRESRKEGCIERKAREGSSAGRRPSHPAFSDRQEGVEVAVGFEVIGKGVQG